MAARGPAGGRRAQLLNAPDLVVDRTTTEHIGLSPETSMISLARGRGKAAHVLTTLALAGIATGLAACGGGSDPSSGAASNVAPGEQAKIIELPNGHKAQVKTITGTDGKTATVIVDS